MITKGTKIEAPDGEGGYKLLHDWLPGIPWNEAKLFEAYGNAPMAVTGMMMPFWLDVYFRDRLPARTDERLENSYRQMPSLHRPVEIIFQGSTMRYFWKTVIYLGNACLKAAGAK